MIVLEKTYSASFLVDRSKMTRLSSIIDESFTEADVRYTIQCKAYLSAGRIISTSTTDHILEIDNSKQNRLEQLTITASSDTIQPRAEEPSEYYCEIGFNGKKPNVEIKVRSIDTKWGYGLFSLLEEQIERTLQQGLLYQIKPSGFASSVLMMLFVGILVSIITAFLGGPFSGSDQTMWLTEADISELQRAFNDSSSVADPQILIIDVYKRQIQNLSSRSDKVSLFPEWVGDWRFLVMLVPVLVILLTFGYLLATCYPSAVFLWGDCEEWYDAIVERRKMLWTVIIWSMIIGIISNLFVFGLGAFIS